MSWVFCVLSHKPFVKWEIDKFLQTHKKTNNTIIKPSFYLAFADTKHNTTVHYDSYEQKSGWLVVGNAYLTKETGYGIAEKNDWKRLIDGTIDSQDMNGGYVIFKWNEQEIEVWNDTLGIQDMFYTSSQGYTIIASRLDWLTNYLDKKPWNYSAFGAFALLPNMFVSQPFMKNVSRFGASSYLKAYNDKFTSGKRRIDLTDFKEPDINTYFFKLNKALTVYPDSQKKLLLQSDDTTANRYTLSLLLNKAKDNWSMLEPYDKEELEQFTSFQNTFNINSEHNPGIDDKKRLFNLWNQYILSTFNSDIPAELNYIHFSNQLNKAGYNFMLHDFSHFYFRNYNYSINKSFIKALNEDNISSIIKHFKVDYSWIREEFSRFLKKGLAQHLQDFKSQLSMHSFINDEQRDEFIMLMLHGVHTHAHKLAFLNQYASFYNPNLHFDLIKARINLNTKPLILFKEYHNQIARNYPELLFHIKAKEPKIKLASQTNSSVILFRLFKQDIIEKLNSIEAQRSPYYNHIKLQKIISRANAEDPKHINTLLKCYAFELVRSHFE
ncbi:MAG: hypothetical protein RBS16_01185 [Candidatus Cloacimonadales bacterium]|jgi:hypothetical protein|nr:hypothetical protein [Candidatus Cloacimonadales bacterium]